MLFGFIGRKPAIIQSPTQLETIWKDKAYTETQFDKHGIGFDVRTQVARTERSVTWLALALQHFQQHDVWFIGRV